MRVIWFHIKTVLRSLLKGNTRALTGLLSLSISLALCVFVLLYARYESSWDYHFKDYKKIYRIASIVTVGNSQNLVAVSPMPLNGLVGEQADVEESARLYKFGKGTLEIDGKKLFESSFFMADKELFSLFSLEFIEGDTASLFTDHRFIAISQSAAHNYFGNNNPIGESIVFNGVSYKIGAVLKDLPANTHFHFNFIASLTTLGEMFPTDDEYNYISDSWLRLTCHTYMKVKDDVNIAKLTDRLNEQKDILAADEVAQAVKFYKVDISSLAVDFVSEPITDIHMLSKAELPIENGIKFSYLAVFVVLSSLILIFAGINFVYITESTSAQRGLELESLMVAGASRFQLFRKLKIEIIVHSFVAAFIALVIVELLIALVNSSVGLKLGLWEADYHSTGVLLFVCVLSIAAGVYPSFRFVYGYPLASAMRKRKVTRHFGFKGFILFAQAGLLGVIFYVLSGMLLTLHDARRMNPGFKMSDVMVIDRGNLLGNSWVNFRNDILKVKSVDNVATAKSVPGQMHLFLSYRVDSQLGNSIVLLSTNVVSAQYFDVMGIQLNNGTFIGNSASDSLAVMLNESAVKKYGLIKPLGERIEPNEEDNVKYGSYVVKGVMKDYHYSDYSLPINPLMIMLSPDNDVQRYIVIKKGKGFNNSSLDDIKQVWNMYLSDMPMDIKELHQYMDRQFDDDFRLLRIGFLLFAVAFYVFITGVYAFSRTFYDSSKYKLAVGQLCGQSVSAMIFRITLRPVIVIFIALIFSLIISMGVIAAYQSIFTINLKFPTLFFAITSVLWMFFSVSLFIIANLSLLRKDSPVRELVN